MRMRRGLKRKRRRWDTSVMTFGHFIPTFSTHTLSVSFNKWKLLTASRRWTMVMVPSNHQSWVVQRQMCSSAMSNPGGGEERDSMDGGWWLVVLMRCIFVIHNCRGHFNVISKVKQGPNVTEWKYIIIKWNPSFAVHFIGHWHLHTAATLQLLGNNLVTSYHHTLPTWKLNCPS